MGRHCLREKAQLEHDEHVRVAVSATSHAKGLRSADAGERDYGVDREGASPLLASNDAQNGELGERERGSDFMAKAPKLNPFGHGLLDRWFSFGRFRENGRARAAD
jgi:hypothetical protein